jgi:hypothetical protein
MDWNLNLSNKQKIVERFLGYLENRISKKPTARYTEQANAVNLQDALQQRHCVSGSASQCEPGRNTVGGTFKKQNRSRDKWFDAK